jgi:phosphatidylserine/phosphatidylglycerophosphate/cardiolipin synthase-like enzyme
MRQDKQQVRKLSVGPILRQGLLAEGNTVSHLQQETMAQENSVNRLAGRLVWVAAEAKSKVHTRAYQLISVAGSAAEVMAERQALIRHARSFVAVSCYVFSAKCFEGATLLAEIYQRCYQAVEDKSPFTLRILHNKPGVMRMVSEMLEPLGERYLQESIEALRRWFKHCPNIKIELCEHVVTVRDSYHQKLWLADQADGVHCLLCSGDVWRPTDKKYQRLEMATHTTGPFADQALRLFNELWPVVGAKPLWPLAGEDEKPSQMQDECKVPCELDHDGKTQNEPRALKSALQKKQAANARDSAILLTKQAVKLSAGRQETPAHAAIIDTIKRAAPGETICFMVSSMNNAAIKRALSAACNRGVVVKGLVEKYHNYVVMKNYAGGANDESFDEVVHGISREKRRFFQLRWATRRNEDGHLLVDSATDRFAIHTKLLLAAGRTTIAGSSAWDEQARYSREIDGVFVGQDCHDRVKASAFDPYYRGGRDYFIDLAIQVLGRKQAPARILIPLKHISRDHDYASPDLQRAMAYELIKVDYPVLAEELFAGTYVKPACEQAQSEGRVESSGVDMDMTDAGAGSGIAPSRRMRGAS